MELVEELRTRLRKDLAAAKELVKTLEHALASLEPLAPTPARPSADASPKWRPQPKPSEAGTGVRIMTICTEAGRPMQEGEILDQLASRGWTPKSDVPMNAVRAALNRLMRAGKMERIGRATYRVAGASQDEDASSPNGSSPYSGAPTTPFTEAATAEVATSDDGQARFGE